MKRILIVIVLVIGFRGAYAQQEPLFTQYMLNDFVLNPAIAGTEEDFVAKFNFRRQWVGIKDAPVTQTLGIHGLLPGSLIGLGGYLFNDAIGPTRRTGLRSAFAIHLPSSNGTLSLGLMGGVFQYRIDGTKLTTEDPNDQVILPTVESAWVPDAGFGLYYFSDSYFAGISMPHLIENNVNFSDVDRVKVTKMKRHYYLYGGYRLEVNDDFSIEPSLLVKAVQAAPFELDVNAKFFFKEMFWVGGSYRTNDAIAILAGFLLDDQWELGYSYDITTSPIKNHSKGSHEIMLGYRFESRERN